MAKKTLTQKEIDGLLAKAKGGDGNALQLGGPSIVKLYDFKRPDKFSKDQMRTLHMLHESFARSFASSLSAYLRMPVTVNMVSVEQSAFEEYLQQIRSPSILGIVSMQPLPGSVIFEVDAAVAFAIVDRLLGGSGKAIQKVRAITEIEQTLVNRVLTYAAEALKESWRHVVSVEPVLEESVVSTQFTKLALPSEVTITISFEVHLAEVTGKMSICIPYSVLEPVIPKLSAPVWLTEWRNMDSKYRSLLKKQIRGVSVSLSAELGAATITISDLLQLEEGDVIRLGSRVTQAIHLMVEGLARYQGKPGLVGSRLGVQITSAIQEEDAEDE